MSSTAESHGTSDGSAFASDEPVRLVEGFRTGAAMEGEFQYATEKTPEHCTPMAYTGACEEMQQQETAAFAGVDISGFNNDVAGQMQRQKAYDLLETILRNLLQFPHEQRYRRLRLENCTLRSQLFVVPGVKLLLASLGFVTDLNHSEGGCLVLPHAPQRELLGQALDALQFLRRRDRRTMSNARGFNCSRQRLVVELRRERCAKAKAVGEIQSYITQEFCADDAGDGLYSSTQSIEVLRTILKNVLEHPDEAKYRRLRLGNKNVHRCVIQQRGALELLQEFAGADVVEDVGDTLIVFRTDRAECEAMLTSALSALDEIEAATLAAREELMRKDREEAMQAMRVEFARAKMCAKEAQNSNQADALKEEEEGDTPPKRCGRRVPLEDAVRFLLGKGGRD